MPLRSGTQGVIASLVGTVLAATLATPAAAQDIVYRPIDPSFGGNPFNSAHLLGIANAQNDYRDPTTRQSNSQADIFARQLQSRLLSALSSQIVNAIFGENPQESGTISFGGQTINFVRSLIEEDRIPEGVAIQVLSQSRQELLERSFESLRGAPEAIMHLYNAVSPAFRRVVFNMSRDEVKAIAVKGAKIIRDQAGKQPDTRWHFQYSPETFSTAELDFSLEV